MTELTLTGLGALRKGIERTRSVWTLIVAIPLAVLALDPGRFTAIVRIALAALGSTLVYVAVEVVLIGFLKASGAEVVVARAFEGRERRMIVLAALLGGLAPFCSCEVIPFVAGLLAAGAPLSAVMAFWLSSPLIDPPTLFITAGVLGWGFAIAKALGAVALGLLGGFATSALIRRGAFANPLRPHSAGGCGGCGASPFADAKPVWRFWREARRREIFRIEGSRNAVFLVKWLGFAYLLEALLVTYVPAAMIGDLVGGEGFWAIVLGAFVGAPAYLNSYAAPPLVAGLMEQGMSAGAAMAFMIAGAVSSVPAMAAVWSLVGRSVFAAYLAFGVGGAIMIGAVFGALV